MSPLFEYRGALYPDYIRNGNAMQFVAATATQFCKGRGLDVGCGKWPLPGAEPIDLTRGGDALRLPHNPATVTREQCGEWDFIFSSHCLEHLANPVTALEHWKTRLRSGGTLFLYLPHPDMAYWRPQHCRKHLHSWHPAQMAEMLRDLGFVKVIHGERDLAWSFAVVGFNGGE